VRVSHQRSSDPTHGPREFQGIKGKGDHTMVAILFGTIPWNCYLFKSGFYRQRGFNRSLQSSLAQSRGILRMRLNRGSSGSVRIKTLHPYPRGSLGSAVSSVRAFFTDDRQEPQRSDARKRRPAKAPEDDSASSDPLRCEHTQRTGRRGGRSRIQKLVNLATSRKWVPCSLPAFLLTERRHPESCGSCLTLGPLADFAKFAVLPNERIRPRITRIDTDGTPPEFGSDHE
jgi:hypothetical protein